MSSTADTITSLYVRSTEYNHCRLLMCVLWVQSERKEERYYISSVLILWHDTCRVKINHTKHVRQLQTWLKSGYLATSPPDSIRCIWKLSNHCLTNKFEGNSVNNTCYCPLWAEIPCHWCFFQPYPISSDQWNRSLQPSQTAAAWQSMIHRVSQDHHLIKITERSHISMHIAHIKNVCDSSPDHLLQQIRMSTESYPGSALYQFFSTSIS